MVKQAGDGGVEREKFCWPQELCRRTVRLVTHVVSVSLATKKMIDNQGSPT